jgi:hypothetical protein
VLDRELRDERHGDKAGHLRHRRGRGANAPFDEPALIAPWMPRSNGTAQLASDAEDRRSERGEREHDQISVHQHAPTDQARPVPVEKRPISGESSAASTPATDTAPESAARDQPNPRVSGSRRSRRRHRRPCRAKPAQHRQARMTQP